MQLSSLCCSRAASIPNLHQIMRVANMHGTPSRARVKCLLVLLLVPPQVLPCSAAAPWNTVHQHPNHNTQR